MLLEKSELVYSNLSSFAGLTSLLTKGANGIRPLIAEEEDGPQFVTYHIDFTGYQTKEKTTEFQVTIRCYAETYNQSVAIADQVENALAAATSFYTYISAKPMFDEQNFIYTEQIFNLKK